MTPDALAEVLSHLMNCFIVKVLGMAGAAEPLPEPYEGAVSTGSTGTAEGAADGAADGMAEAVAEGTVTADELAAGLEVVGVEGVLGVEGAEPELAPSQTSGPGIEYVSGKGYMLTKTPASVGE